MSMPLPSFSRERQRLFTTFCTAFTLLLINFQLLVHVSNRFTPRELGLSFLGSHGVRYLKFFIADIAQKIADLALYM